MWFIYGSYVGNVVWKIMLQKSHMLGMAATAPVHTRRSNVQNISTVIQSYVSHIHLISVICQSYDFIWLHIKSTSYDMLVIWMTIHFRIRQFPSGPGPGCCVGYRLGGTTTTHTKQDLTGPKHVRYNFEIRDSGSRSYPKSVSPKTWSWAELYINMQIRMYLECISPLALLMSGPVGCRLAIVCALELCLPTPR